jgi:hypothetical protein
MFFKIYGERNSGTNFLKRLIEKNFGNTYGNQDGNKLINNKYFFWKHGIPRNYTKNNKENKLVVKIFILRQLEPWLVSMFHNHYHLKKQKNFESFLIKKQELDNNMEHRYINNTFVNKDDRNKTIFQIRYFKYNKIKEYCKHNENIILVNLDYLQNDDNCRHFLNEINRKYKLNKKNFVLIEKHTKNEKQIKNIDYNTNYEDYQKIIDSYKNTEIENEINKLTYYINISDTKVASIYSKI